MDNLFQKCVDFLRWLAEIFNISYEEINIWIFVIIYPIILLILFIWIIKLKKKLKQ